MSFVVFFFKFLWIIFSFSLKYSFFIQINLLTKLLNQVFLKIDQKEKLMSKFHLIHNGWKNDDCFQLQNLIVKQNYLKFMQLTELQQCCWQNIGSDSLATEKIRKQALEFYLEYKVHLKETHSFIETENKIQNLFLIAYFISEKSQIVLDLNGQQTTNVAFSANQLAKKCSDYKQFFFHLKQMMKKITLPSEAKQAQDEINSFMKYFSFVMTFYNKFLSTFDKIKICHNILQKDLEKFGNESTYKDKIKYLLWVLFITFRKAYFKNNMDTIGNTCLLAIIYAFFVRQIYKIQKITSVYAPQIALEYGTFSNQFNQIEQSLLNFFCLKDYGTYVQIRNTFLSFFDGIALKYPDFNHLFSLKLITSNTKKLQQFYYKINEANSIDETLFLKNLVSNQENIKFTAFGARRKIEKHHNSNNMLHCRRVLNYDAQIKNNQTATTINSNTEVQTQKENEKNKLNLEIIHRIKCSQTPVILIQATPINQFTMAYNWLYKKSNTNSVSQQTKVQLNLQYLIQIGYKKEQYQLGNNQIIQKKNLIEGILCELLNQYDAYTEEDINICAILALQVFYYIMNITNRQLSDLVEFLNVSWYSLWQGIDKLLNYDKTMPNNVKTHFLLLQTSIITNYIWKQENFIAKANEQQFSQTYKNFFNRVLHHIAYQIYFLGNSLEINHKVIDQIFILCQFYLRQRTYAMKNINLDVIIMCSIYGACKAKNIDKKYEKMFKKILTQYKAINNLTDKTIQSIQNFTSENGQMMNIISYYNQVFLPLSKLILIKIKEQRLQKQDFCYILSDQQIKSANYLMSPVKQILPSALMRLSSQCTPSQSHMLFAYNQSPLINRRKKLAHIQNIRQQNPFIQHQNLQSQALKDKTNTNHITQMIQKKFGNGKSTKLLPKTSHQKQLFG